MRQQEQKGFRLTAKRQEAVSKALELGKEFNLDVFKDPLTRTMSVDELIAYSDKSLGIVKQQEQMTQIQKEISREEVTQRVHELFQLLSDMTYFTGTGIYRSLIVSGSAGIGKTETVKEILDNIGTPYKRISGNITDGSFYTELYKNRQKGKVLFFDDTDEILDRQKSLNILKAATDTSDTRIIDWQSSKPFKDEDGEDIPTSFEYNGTIIFISNKDIISESKSGAMAQHLKAIISRSLVIDVTFRSKQEYLARIYDVLFNKMDESKYNYETKKELYGFIEDNVDKLDDVSLRLINKLYGLYKGYGIGEWRSKALAIFGKRNYAI